jgi:predicted 2-oxoglutarate/Fe(II)-dependent dioxygenase YbiX
MANCVFARKVKAREATTTRPNDHIMLDIDTFDSSELCCVPNYFNNYLSKIYIEEIRLGHFRPAAVDSGYDSYLNASLRRTTQVSISQTADRRLRHYLGVLQPWLERRFRLALRGFEAPQYLFYRPGDFFTRHIDSAKRSTKSPGPLDRKVSIVIYLNGHANNTAKEGFRGGSLTLFPEATGEGAPISDGTRLDPVPGLLVAFRSYILHEVSSVTFGERFTIVSWFY